MPENTSTEYRLHAMCPKCGELQLVKVKIEAESMEILEPTFEEGKDNAGSKDNGRNGSEGSESAGVRPDNPKGKTGPTDSVPEPTDSGKSKANNSTGGGKSK